MLADEWAANPRPKPRHRWWEKLSGRALSEVEKIGYYYVTGRFKNYTQRAIVDELRNSSLGVDICQSAFHEYLAAGIRPRLQELGAKYGEAEGARGPSAGRTSRRTGNVQRRRGR